MTSANGSGGGYQVHMGDLQSHNSALQQVSDELGQARSAGQTTLASGAYGHLPDAIAFEGIVHAISQPALDALSQAQSALSALGNAIRQTASTYDSVDGDNSDLLRGLEQ